MIVVLIYTFSEAAYSQWLIPIDWLEHPLLVIAGLGLMSVALIWILVAQAQMGASWRIGIDTNNRIIYDLGAVFLGIFS